MIRFWLLSLASSLFARAAAFLPGRAGLRSRLRVCPRPRHSLAWRLPCQLGIFLFFSFGLGTQPFAFLQLNRKLSKDIGHPLDTLV